MVEVVRQLQQEHASMARLLDVLERQIAVFRRGGGPDYDIIEAVVDYCLIYPDQCHHPKEDLVFQALQGRDPEAAESVGDLLADHEHLATLTRRIADAVRHILQDSRMSREWFAQLTMSFIDAYRQHMEMEEKLFFPAALRSLSREDWAEIDQLVTDRDDPLFGSKVEKRFQALRDEILDLDGLAPG
ncbi:MAG: hemerythrin domain-containing protein [Kiloniellales bacterium]